MKTIALALLIASSGCSSTRSCKAGTVFVSITLAGAALSASNVRVEATVDGGDDLIGTFPWTTVGTNTLEIDFPSGYPDGKNVTLRVAALSGAAVITQTRQVFMAQSGCTAVDVTVGLDGGMGCDPMADTVCSTDFKMLNQCRADGSGFDMIACPAHCTANGGVPHCQLLDPSGAADPTDYQQAGIGDVMITADATFNTDTGAISGGFTRPGMGGVQMGVWFRSLQQAGSTVSLGVFGFHSLNLAKGATLHFTGKGPAVLAAAGDLNLDGNLDLTGDCSAPIAGAGAGGTSGVNMGNGLGTRGGSSGGGAAGGSSGGGGGGYGDAGGPGGAGAGAPGGGGGLAFGDLTSEPLVIIGGSGGGVGGGGGAGGAGGHGGGALQVVTNGALSLTGTISAGGCGAHGGMAQGGGGGGGSGGTLLFEGVTVHLGNGAILAANGGGGGGADTGAAGQNGPASTMQANGGVGANMGSGGGAGGAAGHPNGSSGTDNSGANAGGGGGAAGRIAVKSYTGMIMDDGAVFSPAAADRNPKMQPLTTVGRATFQ
jgi:hypothetical protein